jgi:hypothetical protein
LLKIEALEIDDQILDKIEGKHGVTFSEVEEACISGKPHVRKSKEGLYKIFSTTMSGRYLLVVLVNVAEGIWKWWPPARWPTASGSFIWSQLEANSMAEFDKAINKIEQSDAWEECDEVVQIEVKKPLDKVIPVRLSADKWEELRREARELGIGPTTLARMWILERLRQHVKASP